MIHVGDANHGRLIAHKAAIGFDPEVHFCVSRVTPEGNLRGGVVYTNYTGRTVQMHMAGFDPDWVSRPLIWAAFDFPFNRLRVETVFGTVASTKLKVLELDLRLGFKHLVTIPDVVINGDMEVLSMSRSHCRWLKLSERYLADPLENAA